MTDKATLHRWIDELPDTSTEAAALALAPLTSAEGRATITAVGRLEATGSSSLYDTDVVRWTQTQAAALRAKDWAALDVAHLAEEVEDLRKTERKAVRSQLRRLTSHLLKWAYQPARRSDSWQDTIMDARRLVADWLEDDGTLTRELPDLFAWAYPRARREAAKDTRLPLATFPEACRWSLAQVLDEEFLPEEDA